MISPADKKIQELLKGSFTTDKPSLDFTHHIMSQIATLESEKEYSAVAAYTPVISKLTWKFLISGFVIFTAFVISKSTNNVSLLAAYIPKIDVSFQLFNSPILASSFGAIFLLLVIEKWVIKRVSS